MYPYQSSSDPKNYFERILLKIGFKILQLSVEPKDIALPIECVPGKRRNVLHLHLKVVFVAYMFAHWPIELPKDFPSACIDVVREWNDVHTKEDNKEFLLMKYQMVFGHVRKLESMYSNIL
uniref:Uncharacterized protein n=1 Tax=Photinus pyralis TaxID=7054 RepID=A0A1Y1L260_PHOPY